jgi:hypothetical protein
LIDEVKGRAVVMPGNTSTPIWSKSRHRAEKQVGNLPREALDLYGEAIKTMFEASAKMEERGVYRGGGPDGGQCPHRREAQNPVHRRR